MNEEEAARRLAGIGGSDMAAILGASGTYQSAFEIWMEKTGRTVNDEASKPLDLFGVGNALEPAVVLYGQQVAIELGSGEDPAGHQPEFSRIPGGHVQGHPDWRIGTAAIEAKVIVHGAAPENKIQWEMQNRTYMALPSMAGVTFGVVAMLDLPERLPAETLGMLWRTIGDPEATLAAIRGMKWAKLSHVVHVRDLGIEAAMVARADAWFERHVLGDEPPPVDGSKGSGRFLRDTYPLTADKKDRTIRHAEELGELARAHRAAADREKAAKAEKDVIAQELMAAIGSDYGITGTGWSATWARFNVDRVDMSRVKDERPDLIAELDKFKAPTPSGKLTVTIKKEVK